jgi:predicted small lipoprotein YifL
MLLTKQILVSALALGAGVLNLAGCGQTGALYLPARATPVKAVAPTETAAPEKTSATSGLTNSANGSTAP